MKERFLKLEAMLEESRKYEGSGQHSPNMSADHPNGRSKRTHSGTTSDWASPDSYPSPQPPNYNNYSLPPFAAVNQGYWMPPGPMSAPYAGPQLAMPLGGSDPSSFYVASAGSGTPEPGALGEPSAVIAGATPTAGPSFLLAAPILETPFLISPELYASLITTFTSLVWPNIPVLHPPSLRNRPSVYPNYLIVVVLATALKFSKDPDSLALVEASPWSSRSELAIKMISLVLPGIQAPFAGFGTFPTGFELIAMLHTEVVFGAVTGNVVEGFRLIDRMLTMSREINLDELVRTDRTGDDWVRWEERRRLIWRLFLIDRIYTSMSSIRYFTIPLERVQRIPLPCSDALFAEAMPVAPQESAVTLAMFAGGLQAYPLFLPQLSSQSKGILLQYVMTQIIDFQRQAAQHRTYYQQQFLEAQLQAWVDCLPPDESNEATLAVAAANAERKSAGLPLLPFDSDGVAKVHAIYINIFYHWICIILHSPPRGEGMLEDTEWLASDNFLKSAEHASFLLSLLAGADVGAMPMWTAEAIIMAAQIHVLLARKLINFPADEIQRDLREKVDTAIKVLESMSDRRQVTVVLSLVLKLVMTRMAKLGNYFDDDPPPEDLDMISIVQGLRSALGFRSTEEMLCVLESLFGRQGRILNTVKFMTTLLMML